MKSISEALSILKTRKKKYYIIIGAVFLLLFIGSFISGYQLYHTDQTEAMNYLKMISDDPYIQMTLNAFYERNYIAGFLLILGNNLKLVAITLFSGLIFIFPVILTISQAISLGFIMGISSAIKPIGFFHAILTSLVACLEFATIFIVCYEGTNLGLSIFRKKKNKKDKNLFWQTFIECFKILVLIIAILTIAAIIETIGIAVFGSKAV